MYKNFESVHVGDAETIIRKITEADVAKFVNMTGDDNPLHVDRTYAESTVFKDIVVHGMLGASFISTVIGTKLPGPGALWVAQNMEFIYPVRLGDVLTISVTVVKKHEHEQLLELDTQIINQNQQMILTGTGKVKLLTSNKPEPSANGKSNRPRVAIVTGGAGGIGKAICKKLAEDGINIVVNFHDREDRAHQIVSEINKDNKSKAISVQADISTVDGVQTLYKAAVKAFGGVSILVNNASPRINPKALSVSDWSDVQKQIDVQVKGAYLMTSAVVPEMMLYEWGRIVNITSQVIYGEPSLYWTSYAMAKGALAVFSKYMANELGPKGITVNCVSPGMCNTVFIGDISEKSRLIAARQTPLRRLAEPTDVASAVAYLVSDEADFVTGETISVNGGK
jgi:3-oxoacyl-[acyl-carrier protein] reductase